MALFTKDDLVWAKSSAIKQVYWPAKVIDMDYSLTRWKKKPVLACVQFLVEQTYEAITDGKRLLPFNCQQKSVFLNKGRGLKDPCKRLQFDNAVILAEQEINRLEKNDLYKTSRVKSILDGDVIQNESVLAKKRSATSSLRVPRIPAHKVRKLDSEETKSADKTANDNTPRLHKKPEQKMIKGAKRTRMHSCVDEENDSNHVDCSNKHDRNHELTDGLDERHKRKTPYRTKTRRKKPRCHRSVMFDSGIGLGDGENLKGEETENATDVRASMADSSLYGFNIAPNRNREDDMSLERIANRVVSSGEEAKVGKRMDLKDACLNDECESCLTALGQDSSGKKESEGNGQQNGVEEQAVTLDNLNTCSSSDEESDSELPEAFSPSPGAEGLCFRQGDVVWVRFKRLPYWPSQVARIAGRRNPTHYYICFLPKQERKCLKINKKNIVSFTDPEVYERNKDVGVSGVHLNSKHVDLHCMEIRKKQDVDTTLREEFEQALKEAEDILVRRVSPRDKIFFSDDKDLSGRSTNSDENPHSFFDVAESADTASQREGGEQLGTTAEDKVLTSEDSTTPERRKGVRRRRSVSKYNDILLGFHQCKSRLLKIYGEKVQCDRHRKFRYGTTAEKDFLKHRSGFGPIQDNKICEQIVDTLKAWYKELTQKEFLQSSYIFDVWLPEAIIFCIQIKENVNRGRAEKMYLDHAKNTSKEDAEDVARWFREHKIDETAKHETLERAKRAFKLP